MDIDNILWSFQRDAIGRMKNGCILVGGVGTGKSRTAIGYWIKKVKTDKVYIITTAMKRDSHEWYGDLLAMGVRDAYNEDRVTIDSWNNIAKYDKICGSFFIFDEQKLVGSGAWAKSFLKIAKSNQWIVLSGTPGDVWLDYVTVFIANGFFRSRQEFINRHVVYDRFAKYPKVRMYLKERELVRLRDRILVGMLVERSTIRNVVPRQCSYDKELYEKGTKNRWDYYRDEPLRDAGALCYFQRKVVNSSSDRYKKTLEIVRKKPRVIVFYSFDYELEILRSLSSDLNRVVWERNGHRHDTIDPSVGSWVYLVQYQSGSEAWNCITTDTIVFYSRTYSWKIREQAMGRIDRMNTPFRDLYYYELESDSTIDRAIRDAISRKKKFNESAYASMN